MPLDKIKIDQKKYGIRTLLNRCVKNLLYSSNESIFLFERKYPDIKRNTRTVKFKDYLYRSKAFEL